LPERGLPSSADYALLCFALQVQPTPEVPVGWVAVLLLPLPAEPVEGGWALLPPFVEGRRPAPA